MKHKDQLSEKKTSKPDQTMGEHKDRADTSLETRSNDMNKASLMAYLLS